MSLLRNKRVLVVEPQPEIERHTPAQPPLIGSVNAVEIEAVQRVQGS
jgi:hypothetical protein